MDLLNKERLGQDKLTQDFAQFRAYAYQHRTSVAHKLLRSKLTAAPQLDRGGSYSTQ